MAVSYPTINRNYCVFDERKINELTSKREGALPIIKENLVNAKSEEQVLENLYALNILLDKGTDKSKVSELYPVLSNYNNTKSANIQTFLAGIYRKTKIPDAFGPLVKMLIQDSINPQTDTNFDPTEEIGGAILDYIA